MVWVLSGCPYEIKKTLVEVRKLLQKGATMPEDFFNLCSISCLSRGQKDELLRQGCKAPRGSALLCKLDFLTTQCVAHLYVILIVVPVFSCASEIVGVTQGCKTP
jgi:hypothetical protein